MKSSWFSFLLLKLYYKLFADPKWIFLGLKRMFEEMFKIFCTFTVLLLVSIKGAAGANKSGIRHET